MIVGVNMAGAALVGEEVDWSVAVLADSTAEGCRVAEDGVDCVGVEVNVRAGAGVDEVFEQPTTKAAVIPTTIRVILNPRVILSPPTKIQDRIGV